MQRLFLLLLISIDLLIELPICLYKSEELPVELILQNPELPSGCEVTSLAMALNYLGYQVDKMTLANEFLSKGEIGSTHPDVAFPGDPGGRGYGCNPSVIADTVQAYFSSINETSREIIILENKPLCLSSVYLNNNKPVLLWVSTDMKPKTTFTTWILDDEVYTWYFRFHCVVLVKYSQDTCVVLDPLIGRVEYDTALLEEIYEDRGSKMLVIK